MTEQNLPELPTPKYLAKLSKDGEWAELTVMPDWSAEMWAWGTDDVYSAGQMRAYARAAIEQSRVPDGHVLIRKEAIDWLNGETDEGFECPPDRYFRGEQPAYWWRSVFREKAGLTAPAPDSSSHPEPQGDTPNG